MYPMPENMIFSLTIIGTTNGCSCSDNVSPSKVNEHNG